MPFSGKAGDVFSQAGNMVAGFGPSNIRHGISFTASMTPTAAIVNHHGYVFALVSVSIYRAINRSRKFISIFRTSP